ncbi:reverse transcriptase domain-containing protein [Tanacetum coccineum]
MADTSTGVQHQRRVNLKIHEVIKLLDAGLIYPISDSPWVSPVHCVPKKGGMTVVENEDNELIPTRLVTGWRVCIDYRKLNDATRKDHFPLPFMDQMLERLAGNEYYCFLDGFSGYFQIPIDPQDQEKTTFTCPYGTFAYRRMPFGLCNAPGTFQRCMMAIFHDMIEETMEVRTTPIRKSMIRVSMARPIYAIPCHGKSCDHVQRQGKISQKNKMLEKLQFKFEVTSDSDLECHMPATTPLPTTDVREENLDINLPLREHLDTLSTGDREIDFDPIMDIEERECLLADDPVPVPRVFDEPLGDDTKPRTYDVTFSNPLFDFNDDYTLCYDNLLFDEEFEDIRGTTWVMERPSYRFPHMPSPRPAAYSPNVVMYRYFHPHLTSGDGLDHRPKMK